MAMGGGEGFGAVMAALGSVGGSKAAATALGRRQQLDKRQRGSKIGTRRGSGVGGRHGGITYSHSGGGCGRGGCRSPSPIFLEHALEREFTPLFLQMTARVCGGSLPLL